MKNYKDECMDELFSGLVNPNTTSSNVIPSTELPPPIVENLINDSIASATMQHGGNNVPDTIVPASNLKTYRRPGRKKTNKVSFLARISTDKLEKLNWLSNSFGIHKSDIIEEGLTYYFRKFEEKHGIINPSDQKTAADLIS